LEAEQAKQADIEQTIRESSEAERGECIRLLDAIEGLIERQARADAVLEQTKKRSRS
jgi:hypothetical protein